MKLGAEFLPICVAGESQSLVNGITSEVDFEAGELYRFELTGY
jgi:hypothetical protein